MESKKLMFVSPDNNNKFINIAPSADGTSFTSNWGRVGTAGRDTVYPAHEYDKYLNSKLRKGYKDVTEYAVVRRNDINTRNLNSDVRILVDDLLLSARGSISHNYRVSVESVTQKQVDDAQDILGELNRIRSKITSRNPYMNTEWINSKLKELYTILPRVMGDTRDHFLQDGTIGAFMRILQEEQKLLDTMAGQVTLCVVNSNTKEFDLSASNLQIDIAAEKDREFIIENTDFKITSKHKVWRVTNLKTEETFNPKHLKTRFLYHGSRTENYWSILSKGLMIRPKGVPTTGSMLGDGIYFANKAIKSIGYTSLKGSYWASGDNRHAYVCIFEVATGKEWNLFRGRKSYENWMSGINRKMVEDKGYNSVYAKKGVDLRNDEYVCFNNEQVTIRYIIQIEK